MMRSAVAIVLFIGAVGCGSARATPVAAPPSAAINGVYTFSALTPNQLIRGRIRVDGNQMDVEFETPCPSTVSATPRPGGMSSSVSTAQYFCAGAWLTFDRHNPVNGKWYATSQKPTLREVCSRYEMQGGRQVCVSRSTETIYTTESRTGVVQVQRIP